MAEDKLDWLRDDMLHIRTAIDNIYKRIGDHEKECPARSNFLKRKDKDSSDSILAPKFSTMTLVYRFGPIILAAALGLLGLGAYWGGWQNAQKLEKDMAALKKMIEDKK
jgi:hypothetical protein